MVTVLAQASNGGEIDLIDVVFAIALTIGACLPLAITVWALLDVARRPQWAWVLSGRRQVVWLAVIFAGAMTVIGGLVISGYYLVKVRPHIRAVEDGDLDRTS